MKLTTKLLKEMIRKELETAYLPEELEKIKTLLISGDLEQALFLGEVLEISLEDNLTEEFMMAHVKRLAADNEDIKIESLFPEDPILNIHNDHDNYGETMRTKDYNLEYLGNGRYQIYNHDTLEFSQTYDSIGEALEELRSKLSK